MEIQLFLVCYAIVKDNWVLYEEKLKEIISAYTSSYLLMNLQFPSNWRTCIYIYNHDDTIQWLTHWRFALSCRFAIRNVAVRSYLQLSRCWTRCWTHFPTFLHLPSNQGNCKQTVRDIVCWYNKHLLKIDDNLILAEHDKQMNLWALTLHLDQETQH